jgi:release factor glutamine methyltransferase
LILWSAAYLRERGVEQSRLDAEHLLAHTLRLPRLQLYLQHERPLTPEELAAFKPLLRRRAAREPLQYVLGRAAFRKLDLEVDSRVLIPRPETEVLVDVVLEWARRRVGGNGAGVAAGARTLTVVDVGTGSGCIALALAAEGPFRRVLATDASPAALQVAAGNARLAPPDVELELRAGGLLEPLSGERFDALVSNPPYIAEGERDELAPEVRNFEPHSALFAGEDGLRMIRALVAGAEGALLPGGLLALEVGVEQTARVARMIEDTGAFAPPSVHRDLTGRPRIVAPSRSA